MKLTAFEFNEKYPVGTPVTYYPVLPMGDGFLPLITQTRTPAWELGHGEPVVSVTGRAGGVSLRHVELRSGPSPAFPAEPVVACTASIDQQLDALTEARREQEQVCCPHCGRRQEWEPVDLAEFGLITYHGDDGPVAVECDWCTEDFHVQESVDRTYMAAKTAREFE